MTGSKADEFFLALAPKLEYAHYPWDGPSLMFCDGSLITVTDHKRWYDHRYGTELQFKCVCAVCGLYIWLSETYVQRYQQV